MSALLKKNLFFVGNSKKIVFIVGPPKKNLFYVGPCKKNLFYVGLCKKMKIMTFPENMIYKIKNTHFVRDTKKKGKSFLFGLSTLCQSNNLSQQKKDIFFVGMEIDDYFLFGYEPSTSSFLFRFLGFFFLDTICLFCWPP